MTIIYTNSALNVNQDFTLFNKFDKKYYKIIDNLQDIGRNAKLLLKHIAFREYKNGFCSEYQKSIAKNLNVTDRTVRNLTKVLIEKEYIKTDVPDLKERRSLNKKIIYKIIPKRFIKEPEKHEVESKVSGEISAESGISTFNKNKIIKPSRGGFFSFNNFFNKKIKDGYSAEDLNFALSEYHKRYTPGKNPYSYCQGLLNFKKEERKSKLAMTNEAEEIKRHEKRKEAEANLVPGQRQQEYYHHGEMIKPKIEPVKTSSIIDSILHNIQKRMENGNTERAQLQTE